MQEPVYPTPSNSRLPRLLWILAALCLGLVLPYMAEQVQYSITRGELRARADAAAEDLDELAKNAQLVKLSDTSRAFRDVARRVEPSVVHIDTVQAARGGNRALSIEGFEFLLPPGQEQQFAQGQGSGVIVDGDEGYVLTNYHVIQGADMIVVKLSDGRTIADKDVAVVGYDESTDLAVLRVSAMNLTSISWGDSEALEVGDWVLAVGSPYGLDRTVTSGIVSAKQRRGVSQLYQDFLQTDAAVNPGNSGGPLLNVEGKLIGITTAIVGRAFQGISFAIPSKVAKDVYERLKTGGKVVRGWLGVEMQALTPQIAERLKLSDATGALVVQVLPGSPADKGGMKPGDVIVQWNGIDVVNESELPLLVARTEVGSTAKVVVIRDGERVSLDVTVDQRPPEDELQRRRPGNR
jgi:Do/DeqQ family serine protease